MLKWNSYQVKPKSLLLNNPQEHLLQYNSIEVHSERKRYSHSSQKYQVLKSQKKHRRPNAVSPGESHNARNVIRVQDLAANFKQFKLPSIDKQWGH